MKNLVFLIVVLGLGGCMFMSDDDRDFYGKGWTKPTDLDTAPKHHVIPDPSHPLPPPANDDYSGNSNGRPTAKPVAQDPEWIVPQPSSQ